ncbi:unnamed protein product [Arctogadus glacialis]
MSQYSGHGYSLMGYESECKHCRFGSVEWLKKDLPIKQVQALLSISFKSGHYISELTLQSSPRDSVCSSMKRASRQPNRLPCITNNTTSSQETQPIYGATWLGPFWGPAGARLQLIGGFKRSSNRPHGGEEAADKVSKCEVRGHGWIQDSLELLVNPACIDFP